MFPFQNDFFYMSVRQRMYKYCYSNLGAIHAKVYDGDRIGHCDIKRAFYDFLRMTSMITHA